MKIGCKVDGEVSEFEYSCVDYLIKGYFVEDHVQVATLIHLAVDIVQYQHPSAKKVIIQSNNESCFASQELIPFIFDTNTRLDDEKYFVSGRWIFTLAKKQKTLFDTHYSFLNKTIQSYL